MNTYEYKHWGKAFTEKDEHTRVHLLPYHCLDVASVGWVILEKNVALANLFAEGLHTSFKNVQPFICFFLACHDIGKFSFRFQSKLSTIYKGLYGEEYAMQHHVDHCLLGYSLWVKTETSAKLYEKEINKYTRYFNHLIEAFTGHHGKPPNEPISIGFDNFKTIDKEAYSVFIRDLLSLFPFHHEFKITDFKKARVDLKRISWLLAGFTIICDWIGSGIHQSQYLGKHLSLNVYWNDYALPHATQSVVKAGILPSQPSKTTGIHDLFPFITEPSPLQALCESLPIEDGPQMIIIEDVTGSGKTEAALVLAKRMINAGLADGLFMALPTMATTNAMFERLQQYFNTFFESTDASLVLTHSSRDLMDRFTKSILHFNNENGMPGHNDGLSQCVSWIADNKKKAFLADMGAGTIDQALLGILSVKHQSLRLFGLCRKVLVVDEIHSYDEYTNGLLKKLILFHTAFGGSTILLSATLSKKLKDSFTDTYYSAHNMHYDTIESKAYPSITQVSSQGIHIQPTMTRALVKRKVDIHFLSEQETCMKNIIHWHKEGKAVCWIRNTVDDAREAFNALQIIIPKEKLTLFHARFTLGDRLVIEQKVLNIFGKNGTPEQRSGAVLIATQVVEQSLDLDFDNMISDLAPIDLIIQRAGRVHRHSRSARKKSNPLVHIFAPVFTNEPDKDWFQKSFPRASYVYPNHANIWRTQELLLRKGGWEQPEDLRELIEAVYGDNRVPTPPGLMDQESKETALEYDKKYLSRLNSLNLDDGYSIRGDKWIEDIYSPTRLGENSITLRLGYLTPENKIVPINESSKHPWRMSELKIRENLFKNQIINEILQNKVEKEKENMKDKGKWSSVVLFKKEKGKYHASILDQKNREHEIIYDSKDGLRFIEL